MPPSRGLARITFAAVCVGGVAVPLVGAWALLLVAWAFFAASVVIVTARRDGRPMARAAQATLAASVLPMSLLRGSP